ncbi:MAG: sensor histidine kinase [Candidatus Coproplasma sp.]
MIKKLRKKFIIVATCSVLAVLILIVGIINIVNYTNVIKNADHIVTLLQEGGGTFGVDGERISENGTAQSGQTNDLPRKPISPMSPETPFETRFFTVIIDENGTACTVNTDKIAAVDQTQATAYAISLYENNKDKGFCDNYRYGTTDTADGGTMYIFVDCTKELTSFKNFLLVSIIVAISAFVAVFVLVFFLSGKVMKPVAESYAKQKRFITDASHEIKTPLTIIGANTEILEMQGVENEWTYGIKEQIKRLTSLTEKLVFLARMDEESQTLKATDFSLSDAVEETIKPFSAVAVSKGLTLEGDIQKNISYCGDESMIRQLISLLADNALKYSDENGRITVRLKTVGGKIQLTVSNPAKDLDGDLSILFERFYRNDKSRNSQTGGHGIGLSVADAIVSAHKGKIAAHAENGIATFTVTL